MNFKCKHLHQINMRCSNKLNADLNSKTTIVVLNTAQKESRDEKLRSLEEHLCFIRDVKEREQNLISVFAKPITAQKEYLELNSFRCLILCHLIYLDTASISNGISKINFSQSQSRFG